MANDNEYLNDSIMCSINNSGIDAPKEYLKKYRPLVKTNEILVINVEKRPMPFRHSKLIAQKNIKNYGAFVDLLLELVESNEYKLVVVDSFTRVTQLLFQQLKEIYPAKKYAKILWDDYQIQLKKMIDISMQLKIVCWLAIDINKFDSNERTIKVQGQAMQEVVSSYFSFVFWTYFNKAGNTKFEQYRLIHDISTDTEAKTPAGMFKIDDIPNDLTYIIRNIMSYYKYDSIDEINHAIPILIAGRSGTGKSFTLYNSVIDWVKFYE